MERAIYRVRSTLEAPLAAVTEFCSSVSEEDLPPELAGVETTRRGNTFIIDCVPVGEVGRYTPTARIKGSVSAVRVRRDEDGEPTTERYSGPSTTLDEDGEEVEVDTCEVDYVQFKGGDDTVLINSAVREPMFEVLCMLASTVGVRGEVEGIVARDGELAPVRVTPEGEIPVEVAVTDDPDATPSNAGTDGVRWADNPYL